MEDSKPTLDPSMHQDAEEAISDVMQGKQPLDTLVVFQTILEEQKKINRRLDTLQSTVDLIYKDREILEDTQASIAHLKQLTTDYRNHFDEAIKDIKFEIGKAGVTLEEAFSQTKKTIEEVVSGYKSTVETHIANLIESIKPKKVVLVKEQWYKRIMRLFKHE